MYGPDVFGHIWASGFKLTTWPVLPLGPGLKSPLSPLNKRIFINSCHATPPGSHLVICFPNKKVIARLYCPSFARQCQDYHCRAYLLKWEPFPKPLPPKLPPKHPPTIDDIGPPIALALKTIIIPPLTLGYIYEKLKEEKGWFKGSEKSLELRVIESQECREKNTKVGELLLGL